MDTLPLLEIKVSGTNEIVMTFEDPATEVRPNPREGSLVPPVDPIRPEFDPIEHGRALREALLASPPVRDQFKASLRATVYAQPSRPLRICLGLPAESRALHDLGWETLLDPFDDQPLLGHHNVYFFRLIGSEVPIGTAADRPRALVFIANPERLARENIRVDGIRLEPVRVDEEIRRASLGRRGTVKTTKNRRHNYRLELDFRRAVQQVPSRLRPGLRAWLRRYARTLRQLDSSAVRPRAKLPVVALARHTRTFHELDPATGEWRRL